MTTVRANVQTGSELGRLDPRFLVPSSVHGWCESVGNIVVFLSVVFLASFAENAWQYALHTLRPEWPYTACFSRFTIACIIACFRRGL